MADIVPTLVTVLKTVASAGGRVYPNVAPQDAIKHGPVIVYTVARDAQSDFAGADRGGWVSVTLSTVAVSALLARSVCADCLAAVRASEDLIKRIEAEPGDDYDEDLKLHLYTAALRIWQPAPA